MPLSNADLGQIVTKASTLSERLHGNLAGGISDGQQARRRLSRWRQLAAGDDPVVFDRVLRALGIGQVNETRLISKLGPVSREAGTMWPAWALLLDQIITGISGGFCVGGKNAPGQTRGFRSRGRIPYQHLFGPVARLAWDRIQVSCPVTYASLTPTARHGLQDYLLRRISNVVALPLHAGFLAYNAVCRAPSMAGFVPGGEILAGVQEDQRQYEAFVLNQGEDGLRSFFMRHPVAARLTAEVAILWIEFVQEFVGRLEADRKELSTVFNQGVPLGKLTAIKAGVSDPHRGGRSVLLLTFERNLRLVYKPRPMEIDQVFFGLAGELNKSRQAPTIAVLKVLAKAGYGWMEFAPHDACRNRPAVQRFYRRVGALSCLLHWWMAIDCHHQNLIANGEYPVLTDLETIAHPFVAQERAPDVGGTPWSMDGSVLRTGFLPLWQAQLSGETMRDNTGVGAPVLQRSPMPTYRWDRVNTERMSYRHGCWLFRFRTHRPHWSNRVLSVKDYGADVQGGYAQMAKLLSGLNAEQYEKWRERSFSTVRRRVKRPTLVYAYMLQRSISPANLIEAVDRSIELQALPCLDDNEDERGAEIASLERQDIPYFQFGVDASIEASTAEPVPSVPNLFNQREVLGLSLGRKLRLDGAAIRPV